MNYLHHLLLTISCIFLIEKAGLPQTVYTFEEIEQNLLAETPNTGDSAIRRNSLTSLDQHIIYAPYPPLDPQVKVFYTSMINKALLEIEEETVTAGATVWQIYNHGFVVKTPSVCIGFDLMDFFNLDEFIEFAELIDIYFISHEHGDHYCNSLAKAMISLGKPVIGPSENSILTEQDLLNYTLAQGEDLVIAGLTVKAHHGLHSVPVRQFEVITQEGIKILHTGDNQTSETLPEISDVDILLLNAWVNESGAVSHVEGVRLAIDKIRPALTLPGHISELGHLGGGYIVSYGDACESDNGTLASDYCVLGWGEKYHVQVTSNNTASGNPAEPGDQFIEIHPNPVRNQASINVPVNCCISKIELIDITGKTVISVADVTGPTVKLNLDDLQSGIYILRIQADNPYIKKVLVE